MVGVSVRVEGAAQLRRTLKGAGADLGDLTALHREVGRIILPVARAGAPLGPDAGGHIGPSVRVGATRSATIIRAGSAARPYGPAIHFGWFRRHIKPNPWITRAAQQTEPQWVDRYFAGLVQIITQIKGAP